MEKAQIEALIEKYRPRTPKTPDEVNTMGTGKKHQYKWSKGDRKRQTLTQKGNEG